MKKEFMVLGFKGLGFRVLGFTVQGLAKGWVCGFEAKASCLQTIQARSRI